MIKFCKSSSSLGKNAKFFGENMLKIITSVHVLQRQKLSKNFSAKVELRKIGTWRVCANRMELVSGHEKLEATQKMMPSS
jgi:hypothetical protein